MKLFNLFALFLIFLTISCTVDSAVIDREKIQNRRNDIIKRGYGTPFTNEAEENVEEGKSSIFKHPIDKGEDLAPVGEYKEVKEVPTEERPTLEGKGYPVLEEEKEKTPIFDHIPEDENEEEDIPEDEYEEKDIPEDENEEKDIPEDENEEKDIPEDENEEKDIPEDENEEKGIPEEEKLIPEEEEPNPEEEEGNFIPEDEEEKLLPEEEFPINEEENLIPEEEERPIYEQFIPEEPIHYLSNIPGDNKFEY
ncbi:25063_t:CDS:2 [Gigaspora margarita]|uniref:25063_t:CDS:1 n=1 Tax=Gigaspora margarita TaxID=4874 RepID=A0ABM8W3V0_GIGMA|nr:25063_t:CDS:2 [Gigaspora margarita]